MRAVSTLVAKLSKLVVKCLWDLQGQKEAECQDAEECKRKPPLNLVQSNIGLLRVFEPIESIGIGNHWVEGNDCQRTWTNLHLFGPLQTVRIGVLLGLEQLISSPCFFKGTYDR
jgi:hypothetical protein